MHDVTEPLNPHELGHLDGIGFTHAQQIVAREVNEHEVLGPFLLVGEQILLVLLIFFDRFTARS